MDRKNQHKKIVTIIFCILVACFTVGSFVIAAWQTPILTPPNANVPTPLNTSSTSQYKVGSLGLGVSPLSKLDVSGATAIGTYAGTTAAPSNGLIVSGNVGVGTSSPTTNLDVNGTIRIRGGSPVLNYVLTATDTDGNATWSPCPAGTQGLPGPQGPVTTTTTVCIVANKTYSVGYVLKTTCSTQSDTNGCLGSWYCETLTCQSNGTWLASSACFLSV
jgi:hypothetical protein